MKLLIYLTLCFFSTFTWGQVGAEKLSVQDSTLLVQTFDKVMLMIEEGKLNNLSYHTTKGILCNFNGKVERMNLAALAHSNFKNFKGSDLAHKMHERKYIISKFRNNLYGHQKGLKPEQDVFEISFPIKSNNGNVTGYFKFQFVNWSRKFLVAGVFK